MGKPRKKSSKREGIIRPPKKRPLQRSKNPSSSSISRKRKNGPSPGPSCMTRARHGHDSYTNLLMPETSAGMVVGIRDGGAETTNLSAVPVSVKLEDWKDAEPVVKEEQEDGIESSDEHEGILIDIPSAVEVKEEVIKDTEVVTEEATDDKEEEHTVSDDHVNETSMDKAEDASKENNDISMNDASEDDKDEEDTVNDNHVNEALPHGFKHHTDKELLRCMVVCKNFLKYYVDDVDGDSEPLTVPMSMDNAFVASTLESFGSEDSGEPPEQNEMNIEEVSRAVVAPVVDLPRESVIISPKNSSGIQAHDLDIQVIDLEVQIQEKQTDNMSVEATLPTCQENIVIDLANDDDEEEEAQTNNLNDTDISLSQQASILFQMPDNSTPPLQQHPKGILKIVSANSAVETTAKLNMHNPRHDIEECYGCVLCSQSFTIMRQLMTHMLEKHQNYESNQKVVKVKCRLCEMVFPSCKVFNIHLAREHRLDKNREKQSQTDKIQCSKEQDAPSPENVEMEHDNNVDLDTEHQNDVLKDMPQDAGSYNSPGSKQNDTIFLVSKAGKGRYLKQPQRKSVKRKICEKSFTEEKHNRHQKVHQMNFECVFCKKAFNKKKEMNFHLQRHIGENHIKRLKQTISNPPKKDQSYRKPKNMKCGSKQRQQKRCKCNQCGKSFKNEDRRDVHIRTHTGEQPFKCDTCGKRFTSLRYVRSHLAVHTRARPFKCSVCESSFAYKSNLNRHQKGYCDTRKFVCHFCKKSFNKKTDLNSHQQFQTDEKKFMCEKN